MLKRITLLIVLTVLGGVSAMADTIRLNMKDADINALISTVAEATGKNFIVDPRVKGKVTVVSPEPMNRDQLYEVFLSILRVHKFAAVQTGSVIKIVPEVEAKQDGVPTLDAGGVALGGGDDVVTRVVSLKNVAAAQLVPILRPLIPAQGGHLAAYPSSNALIISDRAGNIDRMVDIISRIDQDTDSEIEVIQLQHASASEVSRVIGSLQKATAVPGAPPVQDGNVNVVADERTNSVLLSGDRASRLRIRAIITHLDTPLESGGNTKVIYLRYAQAADLIPVLKGVGDSQQQDKKGAPGQAAIQRSEFDIQADETTNALVITAAPDVMKSLESVIRQLDIRRAQVLVEAVIAEVTQDKAAEFGIQWRGIAEDGGITLGGTDFSVGTSINAVSKDPTKVGSGLSVGFIDGLTTLPDGTEILNVAGLVRALSADTDANLLSTPTLVTMDNQEAEIIVGQNVPFVTGSFTQSGADSTNPFQTIERQDVGLELRVKPQINEGDAIQLEIEQEVSEVTNSTQGADIITNKRSIKTTVIVNDGEMIVLGGLIKDNLNEEEERVPLLGSIPVLGNLFKYRSTEITKNNLLVFLRPMILRDAATSESVMSMKYNHIRTQQIMQQQRKGDVLLSSEPRPQLPTVEDFRLNGVFGNQAAPE